MKEITKTVICPTCKKNVAWITTNTFRPFCSKRCKMIDLGAWANEDYNLPVSEDSPLSEEITQNQH